MTTKRPTGSVLSHAAAVHTAQRSATPAATREYSVRAEAAETVILVNTSRNRLSLEGQRVVLQGALTADILTLFRVCKYKKKAILASLSHLMRLDSVCLVTWT